MANIKPFVALACICEKALQEKDNVLSLIRIIDTVFVGPLPTEAPEGALPVVEYVCVVSLKSGDLAGSFEKLRLIHHNSSGEANEITKGAVPTAFTGGEGGVNIQINLVLAIKKYGLSWFDVVWGDDVLTRIPLRIRPLDERPKE